MQQSRILIVEDEASTRQVYRAILEHAGFAVSEAEGYDQAGTLLAEPFHLVLADIRLQGRSGIDVLKLVRRLHPDCPVIMVSAYADKNNAIAALHAGAADYLEKPVDTYELAHTVKHWASNYALKLENARLRQQSEFHQALRESESLLSVILDSAHEGIVSVDGEQRITFFNHGAETVFGYRREEMMGQPLEMLLPERFRKEHRQIVERFVPEEGDVAVRSARDVTALHRDGTEFTVSASISCVQVHGKMVRSIFLRDVSRQKSLERELRESEARFRTLVEQAPVAVQILDLEGRTLRVNATWQRMWGVPQAALADYSVLQDKQLTEKGVMPYLQRAFAGETVECPPVYYDREATAEVSSPDGGLWVRAAIYPVTDSDGRVQEVVMLQEDITRQKHAEEQLEHTMRQLRQHGTELEMLSEASHRITGVTEPSQFCRAVCEALIDVFDLQLVWLGLITEGDPVLDIKASAGPGQAYLDEITVRHDETAEGRGPTGRAIQSLQVQTCGDFGRDDASWPWRQRALDHGFRSSMAMPLVSEAGKVVGALNLYSAAPEFFSDNRIRMMTPFGHLVATLCHNIRLMSGLQAAVEKRTGELAAAKEEAEAANRAKSTFLANISHELRTPLTSVIGYAAIMMQGVVDPASPEYRGYAANIHDSGRHLLRIINDILDLSKIEADMMELEPAQTDVAALIGEVMQQFSRRAQAEGVALKTACAAGLPPVQADASRIRQVLGNLVSNAVKFNHRGGRVEVSADLVEGAQLEAAAQAALSAAGNGGVSRYLKVSVEDNGDGIEDQKRPLLFQPFQLLEEHLSKAHDGTGLGLALTRKLVDMHGGAVWLQRSRPGEGSIFSFVLPILPDNV